MRVLNFGSLNLDYVYGVGHFVQPGETLAAISRDVKHGGKGLNQSIALVRAGADTAHAGCVGQGGESLLAMLVEEGAHRGLNIALNPSPYNDSLREVDYGKLTWVLVNEIEAEQITGESDPVNAWKVLHVRYPRLSALITLGGKGSMAFRVTDTGVETVRQAAQRVHAVDTTAAGDTFTGYFIAGLMENMPLQACMGRASHAAV